MSESETEAKASAVESVYPKGYGCPSDDWERTRESPSFKMHELILTRHERERQILPVLVLTSPTSR